MLELHTLITVHVAILMVGVVYKWLHLMDMATNEFVVTLVSEVEWSI